VLFFHVAWTCKWGHDTHCAVLFTVCALVTIIFSKKYWILNTEYATLRISPSIQAYRRPCCPSRPSAGRSDNIPGSWSPWPQSHLQWPAVSRTVQVRTAVRWWGRDMIRSDPGHTSYRSSWWPRSGNAFTNNQWINAMNNNTSIHHLELKWRPLHDLVRLWCS